MLSEHEVSAREKGPENAAFLIVEICGMMGISIKNLEEAKARAVLCQESEENDRRLPSSSMDDDGNTNFSLVGKFSRGPSEELKRHLAKMRKNKPKRR